jgi:hypothetical protein
VVFPAPLGPSRPKTSPFFMEKDTSSKAIIFFLKIFDRFSTSINVVFSPFYHDVDDCLLPLLGNYHSFKNQHLPEKF